MAEDRRPQPPGHQDPAGPWVEKEHGGKKPRQQPQDRPDDRDRTRLRATAYAAPHSPTAAVGVVVLDPPPTGQVRTASVTALELVAATEDDGRRGYRATVAMATGPPDGPASTSVTTAYVVLARQPDGRWLVVAEARELGEGDV